MAEYDIPQDLRYTREDEWVRLEAERATVGVTDYAQQQLGDIVYVELPEVGAAVQQSEPFGVIESVKAVSDLYTPLSGTVVAVNAELADQPEKVNESCYGEGWMIVITGATEEQRDALLDAAAYRRHVEQRSKK